MATHQADALILAAGLSSRMGSWKMMLPYRQGTILDAAINNALGFCSRVVLVTGYRGDELHQRYCGHSQICLVANADYHQGMFSSIRCGVQHIESRHFFLALGDMPCISSHIYAQLWQQRGDYCLIPRFEGGKGHPVLLPQRMIEAVRRAMPEQNMKQIIQSDEPRYLAVENPAIHWDIDTPEQYRRLPRREVLVSA